MHHTYWEHLNISGPNGLSKCPESRERDFGHFGENIFRQFLGILEPGIPTFFEPRGQGQGAGGGALRVGCGRSARRDFSTMFWARLGKAVRQGVWTDFFMREPSYQQRGEIFKRVVLTF